ncbi:alginate lyase family protein [Ruficoccus sp. ZRK36]|uniref:alginate lyase family protein n=1 Tax=Ruficoccus sp. ZRK36 TaxID=2866311 RepID=UPI001C738976|nr:alginate lyase family protein [Ruficoccus sp. ZRK36]QYY35401.1 alginate lyase family protein [Ruficoccus sp. ZRK36]
MKPTPMCLFLAAIATLFINGCQETKQVHAPTASGKISIDEPAVTPTPATTIWQGEWLAQVKEMSLADSSEQRPEITELLQYAEADLNREPPTIVNKAVLPASGDPHDYFSMGPYWWPNPDTEDGLPYVRRDGQFNKENLNDMQSLGTVISTVRRLGLAYYLTGDERYAQQASLWLRTFFLDEATRMNPHLRYSQAIPGKCEGRSIGMIDTWSLPTMLDAVTLLQGSPYWTAQDESDFRQWVSDLLDWFLHSDYAAIESSQRNNHSVWYFAQVGAYGIFSGRGEEIRQLYVEKVPELTQQISPDGSMPEELSRTRPLHYTTFCLQAFLDIQAVCDEVDLELTDQQVRVHQAVSYLGYYMDHPDQWPYKEMRKNDARDLWTVFRRAGTRFDDPRCSVWEQEAPPPSKKDMYMRLVFAPPPSIETL